MTEREEKYMAFVKDDMENNRGRLLDYCEEINYLFSHPGAVEIMSKHYLNIG